MESLSPQVVAATKLPILNPNKFDLWKMRMEQHFLMTDYSLWEVILNGDSPTPTRIVNGYCLPNEEIFAELARMGYEKPPPKLSPMKVLNTYDCSVSDMVRNMDSPSKFLMYPWFLQVMINAQVDDLSSHTTKYTSPALTQKIFANMRRIGKGFLGVETPLFATMLVQPQAAAEEEDDDDEVSAALTPPSPTPEQPTYTSESSMTLLNTLMKTCATLTQKVAHLEQDKVAQALEITKLKQRVKKLERQRRSKHSGLKRLRKRRMEEDVTAVKEINASEPAVFDDEEVTMTMAQTLIKMKGKKARILDEQSAKRMQDEEIKQAVAREKQEKEDLERLKVLQQQYDQKQENINWNVVVEQMQEKHLDNIKKYQSLKRKPISVAQARKNMILYLKNMTGYKMQHFKGMTYDQVRPIFEREYKSVQTFLNSDRNEEPTKKRDAKEIKLRVEVEVSGSHSTQQDTLTVDPTEISEEDVQNMLQIILMT
nr:ribonuclease H-like domain-containing protein [Tanacetum cinerariifolium]